MNSPVFDASAVLAVLNRERAYQTAEDSLYGATISAVNYGEVLKKSAERGGEIAHVRAILTQQRLEVVAFDLKHSVKAAEISEACRPHGLSFADRACLSLGLMLDKPVVTAEEQMVRADLDVEFKFIRNRKVA